MTNTAHTGSMTTATNVTLALCAVVLTLTLVRREFFGDPVTSIDAPRVVAEEEWLAVQERGHVLGDSSSPRRLVVFGDFQCPACKSFAVNTLPAVERALGGQVTIVFRHWPLSYHEHARAAAIAAECAGRQRYFRPFHDALYRRQDEIGRISFEEFAAQVGVPDSASFVRCQSDPSVAKLVDADAEIATRIGGRGTPTIVLDGTLYYSPPDSSAIHSKLNAR